MAFVSQSSRKINEISKTMCPLGPGQYFKEDSSNSKKNCAPFQSTNRRRSFLDVNTKQLPGPGNYEVSKPFVQPNIKTVSNSQSIIVKINSTGTAQFKSVIDRFETRDLEVPGPGKYDYSLNKSPKSYSHSHSKLYDDSIIQKLKKLGNKKNHPTIPEKGSGLTDSKKEQTNPEGKLGPAYYNPKRKTFLNSTSTAWGKDKSKRFSLDSKAQVGPGKYNSFYNPIKPQDKINQPASQFRSNTVRTYFDSLYYQTNIAETAKVRDQSKYKQKEPAPGQYQTNISSIKTSEKPFALQFFGSTVERFPEQEEDLSVPNQKKHKSFYNVRSQIGKNRSFNKSDHGFMFDTSRKPDFLSVNQKQKRPGPGYYKENIKVQKKLKGQKIEKFGSNTKRIFQQQAKEDILGPGLYFTDKKSDQEPKNRFGQLNNTDSNFRSTTNRDCFGLNNTQKHPFAEYDVSHHDLSKKVEKQKNFIQNLKKIDVERPGFESSISRFPHYDGKQKKQIPSNAEESRKQQMKLKEEGERIREMVLNANHAQVKEVQKHHFGKKQRFIQPKKAAPPVGNYTVRSTWEKKSHNVKYNKNK